MSLQYPSYLTPRSIIVNPLSLLFVGKWCMSAEFLPLATIAGKASVQFFFLISSLIRSAISISVLFLLRTLSNLKNIESQVLQAIFILLISPPVFTDLILLNSLLTSVNLAFLNSFLSRLYWFNVTSSLFIPITLMFLVPPLITELMSFLTKNIFLILDFILAVLASSLFVITKKSFLETAIIPLKSLNPLKYLKFMSLLNKRIRSSFFLFMISCNLLSCIPQLI